ncbi:hypothetical protein [Microbacterium sp. MYb62]|uniref:hypothetical protein n=1 Tax=Microbacterium sp. MYb62 TaxID=1848690 RepID=UPI002157D6CD|nr:hypothetical protein [Microbacterium sp. MYb62]
MKARLVLVGAGIVLAAALVVLLAPLGFPVPFVIAWIVVALVVALASRQVFFDEGDAWPPEEQKRVRRGSEVSRLAWAINSRTGVAGHMVVRRVQSVLRRRLVHRGLDLDDPAQHESIDALLGEGVRDSLRRREVTRTDIERVLDAMDRIPNDTEETG